MDTTKTETVYDLLVIGGGINGAGIAADAASRGLSVCLCEQDDLASYTSSWSTKLVHGGLRYLEQYEFRLVREALRERAILCQRAPHLVKPQLFHIPKKALTRPGWMIQAGLWLYDHLSKRNGLPASGGLTLKAGDENPLLAEISKAFYYTDCRVDDARLVIINAQFAKRFGALIKTRFEVQSIEAGDAWIVTGLDKLRQQSEVIAAKSVVNASGPWVSEVGQMFLDYSAVGQIQWVKGSHIILPKWYDGDQAYVLQQPDGRIIFAIPYLEKYCLVGTTDETFSGDLKKPAISTQEIDYLLAGINEYFKQQHTRLDIVQTFAGVRPLYDESGQSESKLSREYHLQFDCVQDSLPLVQVYGGKLTTYRALAEKVVSGLQPYFPDMKSCVTRASVFSGSHTQGASIDDMELEFYDNYAYLPKRLTQRWWQSYGLDACRLLDSVESIEDLGDKIAEELYGIEVDYLIENEWAKTTEDILWRRSKLGLNFDKDDEKRLDKYLEKAVS